MAVASGFLFIGWCVCGRVNVWLFAFTVRSRFGSGGRVALLLSLLLVVRECFSSPYKIEQG